MTKQTINLGTAANNGNDGDDARTAFSKVNDNFTEVYALAGGAQPVNTKLTTLAAAVWAANQLQYQTGAGTVANTPLTVAARALLDDPDSPAMRVTLGLGGQILQALQALTMTANGVPYMASASTMAVQPSSAFGRGLWNLANGGAGRVAFGALGEGDFGIGNALSLAAGTDLNTLTTPGMYAYTSGSLPPNSPYGAAQYIEVLGRSAYPAQVVRPIYGTGDTTWTRFAKTANPTSAAADWGGWLPSKLGNFGIGERQSPDTTDAELSSGTADTGLLNGMSRIIVGGTAGGAYKGLPNQDTYAITTNRSSSGVYTHQLASGHAANRLYFRRASSVDFEPLVKFGDAGIGLSNQASMPGNSLLVPQGSGFWGGTSQGTAGMPTDTVNNGTGIWTAGYTGAAFHFAIATVNRKFHFGYSAGNGNPVTVSEVFHQNNSAALPLTTPLAPSTDNNRQLGTSGARWSVVYSATGAINTSDAREKTPVDSLSENEAEAAKLLSKEIGVYRWLKMVEEKGDSARKHIGLTVQRAIQIMESCGLDPFSYGFICYDEWEDEFEHSEAVTEPVMTEEVWGNDPEGLAYLVSPSVQALDEHGEPMYRVITEATDVQVKWGGNRYSFRYDELNLFIAAGIESRLSALEQRM